MACRNGAFLTKLTLILTFAAFTAKVSGAENVTEPVATTAASVDKSQLNFSCIVCDDLQHKFCKKWDGFSHSQLCKNDKRLDPTKPFGCRTTIQQVYNKRYVSRQCTNLIDDSLQGCIERVGTYKIKMTYCHCREKNCNSAGNLAITRQMLLMPLILLLTAMF